MSSNNNISHVFCGSPFWDSQLSWNTSEPTLTNCFQRTILLWVPCAFLWLMLPFRIFYLYWHKKPSLPSSYMFILKIICAVLLVIVALVEVFHAVMSNVETDMVPLVEIISPTTLAITVILSIVFLHIERKGGISSSGILTCFWFLLFIAGFFRFLFKLKENLDMGGAMNKVLFVTSLLHYLLVVLEFFMACFVHKNPTTQQNDLKNVCPEERASFVSRISFWWVTGLVVKGYRKVLQTEDLWSLGASLTSTHIVSNFNRYWAREMEKYKLSEPQVYVSKKENGKGCENEVQILKGSKKYTAKLLTCLVKAFGGKMLLAAFYKLLHDLLLFTSPILLKLLIQFTNNKTEFLWKGFLYAVILLITSTLQSVMLHKYFHQCLVVGMKLKTTIISAVYNKSLKLSNSTRKSSTVGEIVNLMSVDAQKFQDLMTYINTVWSGPFQIIVALYFLWLTLGPAILTGVGVLALLIPYNLYLTNAVKKLQVKQMKLKDARIKMMNEVLNGIKVLKLYAWEKSFRDQVMNIRKEELKVLRKHAYLNAGTTLAWNCTPVFVSLFTFVVYILSDEKNILDAEKAFVALSLFNILRFPMMMLPNMISSLVQAKVSVNRVRAFLTRGELDPSAVQKGSGEAAVAIDHGTFKWDKDEDPILKDIQLKIPPGSLIAVVGVVGSGKSSLISAILGEMEKTKGSVQVQGSIAYVPQQSWIQNKTLQENILFGKPYSKSIYKKTLDVCALIADLQILPAGDQTEIGEKGINLSGGQKQRVSLARAVYQNSDIYLLDDPLSAVDSHVGKHLFDQVIGPKGILAGKTRILVTHGISFLPRVDLIVVLKNGQISEKGTFQDLLAKKGAFSDFLQTYLTEQMQTPDGLNQLIESEEDIVSLMTNAGMDGLKRKFSKEKSAHLSQSNTSLSSQHCTKSTMSLASVNSKGSIKTKEEKPEESKPKDKLIQAETAMTGNVKLSVFLTYGKAVGLKFILFTLLFFLFVGALNIYSNIWLSEWSNDALLIAQNGTIDTARRDLRLGVYGAIGLTESLMVVAADLFLFVGCLHAADLLHKTLLHNVLFSPMTFFDQTPIGRLLNRFGKDIETIDFLLVKNIESWMMCLLKVLSVPIVIMLTTPMFGIVCIPLFIIYTLVQRFYIATSRQLKRLESVSRSPIFSHFGETITGVASIRAYNKQDHFIAESEIKVDNNNVTYYPTIVINRWLAFRVEFLSNLIVFFASVFAVVNRETLSPGSVGLSISYALSITQTLNWLIRMTSELETNVVAVERIKEYSETPTEAPSEIPNNKPAPEWPDKGEVIFTDYATRYREDMDLVVKNINCHIQPGEKIGVVGRTGAGKSSLTLGLFRIIEPALGTITIDGLDISKLGLYDLRSKLTIIPQDPVLFSGTLRMNLDPFEQYTDASIWEALEHSHLKEFVSSQPKGLQHECSEGGENLSLGQRQLVCLARALLRKTKILILDEATAAVDLETDDLIQQTIHSEFRDCTIITIAHRLNTILDYSRIMVLDNGKICEFDSSETLLQNKNSILYSMAAAAYLVGESSATNTVNSSLE